MKPLIRYLLERSTARYLNKHKPLLILVTGSVGKTSTKMAIATVLAEHYKVRVHEGNHNTHFSVPAAIMGVDYPDNPRSPVQWLNVLKAMKLRIDQPRDVDAIVQELGTDAPGDIAGFTRYLKPDVAVVTAVSEEHMEFFGTLEAVAKEELSIAKSAKLLVVGRDDVAESFAGYADISNVDTYGLSEKAEYRLAVEPASPLDGRIGRLVTPEWGELSVTLQLIGDHSLKAAVAAACVGSKLGLTSQEIIMGLSKIKPVSGRMNVLRGVNQSTIIDDTYNSSPLATSAALQTLMAIEAPQRIAILGSMNELGATSAAAHERAGQLCDGGKIEWVITIGADAERYLAPAAAAKGCQVRSFKSPFEAGGFVHKVVAPGAVILAKGSQNGVFAEEAVKVLLHSTEDETQLVRQSSHWLHAKDKQFEITVKDI
ncbi:MAG TPA: UDP-N-acetylmuramoyl-tripeptide--D-alanyl-D-alanine ligase [Candidatus Saccharimonadales bacterium]|jgi:UDP-N-acetylmuramoyl-tripeptide--D-alanyl-D-alanine ligase